MLGEDWQRKNFASSEIALAFAEGLTYGDEPQWEVDLIERCPHGGFDVVFTVTEDEADPLDAAGIKHDPHV